MFVHAWPSGENVEEFLELYLKNNVYRVSPTESQADYDITVEPYHVPDYDGDQVGRHFRKRSKLQSAFVEEGFLVVARRGDQPTLHIACQDPADFAGVPENLRAACHEAILTVLHEGLPEAVFSAKQVASNEVNLGTFAGKSLKVPEGCQNNYPNAPFVDCGAGGKLSWLEQPLSPKPLSDALDEAVERVSSGAKSAGQLVHSKKVPCRIDGADSTCTEQVLLVSADEPPIFVYHGLAKLRGTEVMLVCSWQNEGPGAWPPEPCDQVLTFPESGQFADLRMRCEKADADACFDLGMAYVRSPDVATQSLLAAVYLSKGCDAGKAAACSKLGFELISRHGKARDAGHGIGLLRRGCDNGDAEGCSWLGYSYLSGFGVTKDVAHAVELLQKGCDGGNVLGCSRLGSVFALGEDATRDMPRAVVLFNRACDAADLVACTNLAHAYLTGDGITKDSRKAVNLLAATCDKGEPTACGKLASAYAMGQGVKKDLARAGDLFRQACDGGDTWACDMKNRPVDYWVTRDELQRSCEKGKASDCYELGLKWGNGDNGPADLKQARTWVKKGCDKGFKKACEFLSEMAE